MTIFYYDSQLDAFEKLYQWNHALNYLEKLYSDSRSVTVLISLVGYSWYYLVEGPLVSRKYADDSNEIALEMWKKYLDIGTQEANTNPFFNFIAGYTLSLHGFLLSAEYEKRGSIYLKNCISLANDSLLCELAQNIWINQKRTRYKHLKNDKAICKRFFGGDALLDKYFTEIFTCGGEQF